MLDGKVALVTGSAHGIGKATAQLLAQSGASVVLTDVDAAGVELAAKEIGPNTAHIGMNLTEPDAPQRLIDLAIERFGRIDIIVNNAGYTLDVPIHKMSDADFQAMI